MKMENENVHYDYHSIRLRGYVYSRLEAYFITLCTSNRECLFGEIIWMYLLLCPIVSTG